MSYESQSFKSEVITKDTKENPNGLLWRLQTSGGDWFA